MDPPPYGNKTCLVLHLLKLLMHSPASHQFCPMFPPVTWASWLIWKESYHNRSSSTLKIYKKQKIQYSYHNTLGFSIRVDSTQCEVMTYIQYMDYSTPYTHLEIEAELIQHCQWVVLVEDLSPAPSPCKQLRHASVCSNIYSLMHLRVISYFMLKGKVV